LYEGGIDLDVDSGRVGWMLKGADGEIKRIIDKFISEAFAAHPYFIVEFISECFPQEILESVRPPE
jgi:adenosine/AMP kinase